MRSSLRLKTYFFRQRQQKRSQWPVLIAADLTDFELATSLTALAEPRVLDRLIVIAANARALVAEFTFTV